MRPASRLACFALLASSSIVAACSSDEPSTATSSGSGGATTSSSTTGETTASSSSATTSSSTTGAGGGGAGGGGGQGGAGGSAPITAAECFADDFVHPLMNGPNYDQFSPVIGSHCMGTNHQDITGVERVVFLGDSITVGTPPTLSGDFYRSLVADQLAAKFGLSAPNLLWKSADPFNGTAVVQESGAFASCSKWGARTDDLLAGGDQIADCFPPDKLDQRTLVVMTMGGNDLSSLTKAAIDGATTAELWAQVQGFVELQREAIAWLTTPGRFPNGVFVVFSNNYEFTDGTGDVQSCDVSGLAGFDQPVPSPAELSALVVWANEQYLSIAVDNGVDMIFLLEDFCGHGFNADDPDAPCYRGPGNENWFDLTCIHPNPTGHQHVADMFMAVVNE
jgi:lysophospholipase L1-like esterase